ncbi:hypothetical protein ACKFKG_24655 [Phormidesmis sp. 146-35]
MNSPLTNLSDAIATNLQNSIGLSIQNWLEAHPITAWMVAHPLWVLGLVVLAFFLFWGLLNLIARLTERLWLIVLQAPIKLIYWLGTLILKPFSIRSLKGRKQTSKEQLKDAIEQLEELKSEQEKVLKKIKSLLASQPQN